MTIHEDFDKLSAVVKLYDEMRDWVSYAAPNGRDMLRLIEVTLNDAVDLGSAGIFMASIEGFESNLISLMDTSMFSPVMDMLNDTIIPPPEASFFRAFTDFLANSDDYTGTITLTNGANTIAGVGTAFLTELKDGVNGDYLYLEQDGIASMIRITNIANDTTATFVGNYAGGSTDTDVRIARPVQSRGVSKSITYSSSMGNKAIFYHQTTDKWGFEFETPKKADTFKLIVTRPSEYSGLYDIICESGEEENRTDPNGCRPGVQVKGIGISNTESEGILDEASATFPYSTSADSLANSDWYSASWTNAALSNTEFAHAEVGSKEPLNWTGTGSSLDLSGVHNMKIKLSKDDFSKEVRYCMLAVFRYKDTSTTGDLKFDTGGKTETFDGTQALTGTVDFLNGNTAITGTNTKFLSEVREGDHIKADAHAAGTWTEVASIESDTALTLVAGGYSGANSAAAAASNYFTGWHWEFIDMGFYGEFISEIDLEAEIDLSGVIANNIYIDTFQIYQMQYHAGTGIWFRWFAGETDVNTGDCIQIDVAIATEAKIQRWMADQYNLSMIHVASNPTFPDPA